MQIAYNIGNVVQTNKVVGTNGPRFHMGMVGLPGTADEIEQCDAAAAITCDRLEYVAS